MCGVPSFDAFDLEVDPGCCCWIRARALRIRNISVHIEADASLVSDHRDLALDMVRHFERLGSTVARSGTLWCGILLTLASVIQFAAGVTPAVPGAMIAFGIALLAIWAFLRYRAWSSAQNLRDREKRAIEIVTYAPLNAATT
jgi:protein-S-isoprenylcysteine O-methyltransferase Ste14